MSHVSCNSWSSLHRLQQGFWPTPPYRSSPDLLGFGVLAPFKDFSMCFRSKDWLGHSRMEPLPNCPGCVFWVIVMLEDPAMTHLQYSHWGKEVVGQNLAIHEPIHPAFNTVQSSCPLCRKAPPKYDVSTLMLHGWDNALGVVLVHLLHPNTASGVDTKKLYYGLIWPHDLLPCLLWIIQTVTGELQRGLDMCCCMPCRILNHDGVVRY